MIQKETLLREFGKIERRHGPARGAEENQVPARTKDVEVLIERGFANAVVNNVNPFPVGEALRFHFKILLRVENHFIGSSLARELRFFLGAGRPDDSRSDVFLPSGQEGVPRLLQPRGSARSRLSSADEYRE